VIWITEANIQPSSGQRPKAKGAGVLPARVIFAKHAKVFACTACTTFFNAFFIVFFSVLLGLREAHRPRSWGTIFPQAAVARFPLRI
jgi:hypothetical protein